MQSIKTKNPTKLTNQEILNDYRIACESREASLIGRKEVFMGKAKFGIFGDGKELAQIAMARSFQDGDFRSGYYRDQTFMFAIGELTLQQYFAQLYAHTSVEEEPASAGRMMNGHFATRMLDDECRLKNLTTHKNVSSDISPTAAQMPRLVGMAWASKLFRNNEDLGRYPSLSDQGNEVAFGTIGNASTSEGLFWEAINAGGVLQIPMVVCVWDDEYGISVPKEYHTTKESISEVLSGFQKTKDKRGYNIYKVRGWDYVALLDTMKKAASESRKSHTPALIHVVEMTQPQGHSTSGSHERYKSKERLEWEREYDCIEKFREWILENEIAEIAELEVIEKEAKKTAKDARGAAWKAFNGVLKAEQQEVLNITDELIKEHPDQVEILNSIKSELANALNPIRVDIMRAARKANMLLRNSQQPSRKALQSWIKTALELHHDHYSSHLYSESSFSAMKVNPVQPSFNENSPMVDGREVLQACFDKALDRDPLVLAFGEDLGKIGDVNQAFAGLQEKYGEDRVGDTGIREATIIGQGIGAALRGLRPIAEIQYLDYLLYAIQTLSDDLATLQYRTKGGQKAPLIIRTRGHRLEGVWHSGSPMGMILNSIRGIYVLVPRNMTKAAAFYNTMLQSDDTALIIECLNGYRLKEQLPENIDLITEPLGVPEVIREGNDVTVVTYGSMCRIVMSAAEELENYGVSCEVIDVQTLLPFDVDHTIVESLKKTNRVVFADEDVPGGASAFMMQKVLEEQVGYKYLDSQPLSITSKEHRPAYSSDGDYFSKPNVEDIVEGVYGLMSEADPTRFPDLF